jgi:serine/threonine protein kinase
MAESDSVQFINSPPARGPAAGSSPYPDLGWKASEEPYSGMGPAAGEPAEESLSGTGAPSTEQSASAYPGGSYQTSPTVNSRGSAGPCAYGAPRHRSPSPTRPADATWVDPMPEPLDDCWVRFRALFGHDPSQEPLRVGDVAFAPRLRIGERDEIPLLLAKGDFRQAEEGGYIDSSRRMWNHGRMGSGAFGSVHAITFGGSARPLAMKLSAAAARAKIPLDDGMFLAQIQPADAPQRLEYATGRALKAMAPDLNLVFPECIFGLLIPGQFQRNGMTYTEVFAVCVAMPMFFNNVSKVSAGYDTDTGRPHIANPAQRLRFVRNLVRGTAETLARLHALTFTHGDIKSDNLLIPFGTMPTDEAAAQVHLCDYSLSRFGRGEFYDCMSSDYRAPEVWLNHPWGPPVDVWGLGCVAMEMFLVDKFYVDFPKCHTNEDFILQIAHYFGPYVPAMLERGQFTNRPAEREIILGTTRKYDIRGSLVRAWPELASVRDQVEHLADLLERIFVIDPAQRLTAAQMLDHPFLARRSGS